MRIISQDGRVSIEEYQMTISVEGCAIMAGDESPRYPLGGYKTKERALEVFNELHAVYEELPFSGNSVYRMPQE